MDKEYNVQDALNILLDGNDSEFASRDEEELNVSVKVADAVEDSEFSRSSEEDEEIQFFPKKNTDVKWEKTPFEPPDISFV